MAKDLSRPKMVSKRSDPPITGIISRSTAQSVDDIHIALANQYRAQGLDMLFDHAQYEDKSTSVEAGLMDMLTRMEGGRFKVFDHNVEWLEEFRLYHRRDGKVVKERDDLMSATRYAIMMLRYARTIGETNAFNRKIVYGNKG